MSSAVPRVMRWRISVDASGVKARMRSEWVDGFGSGTVMLDMRWSVFEPHFLILFLFSLDRHLDVLPNTPPLSSHPIPILIDL